MYFPYLFGRQSELRALQSLCTGYSASGKVVPVIEPVVKKPNDLLRCLGQLGEKNAQAVIVLNPEQGDFNKGGAKEWRKEVNGLLRKHKCLIPAIKCGPKVTAKTVESSLKAYSTHQTAILYSSPALTDDELAILTPNPSILYHICLQGKISAHQRYMLPSKKAVDIVDYFNKQVRNADYSGTELFTDQHKLFAKTGIGFGDYTVTGSIFQPGGGKPGAVALHMTYKHPKTKDVWVEHFVSDDMDVNTGSAASKYLEAVSKLTPHLVPRKTEFGLNSALDAYALDANSGHFPGLGKSKERQIYHHIAVMHDVLHGKL